MNIKKSLLRCFSLSAIILFALSSPTFVRDTLHNNKMITNMQMLGIGAVNTLGTYLSPEEYTGTEFRYIFHSVRESGTKLSRELIHQAQILSVHNRKENSSKLGAFYSLQYNWRYALGQWNAGEGESRLKVGGGIDIRLGFLYNMHNSSNPAQAYAQLNISPNTVAAYRFHLRNIPLRLRYEVQAPLLGPTFSPSYRQSYYGIFTRDNYGHNLVVTTPVSAPSFHRILTLDFTPHHATFRVGYPGNCQ